MKHPEDQDPIAEVEKAKVEKDWRTIKVPTIQGSRTLSEVMAAWDTVNADGDIPATD